MDRAETFRRYAEWVEETSPLYAVLTRAVADDPDLLDVSSEASAGQPEPQLLLAAVQALLLEGREHPLARFYPSCGGDEPDDDPVPHFRDFCLVNEQRLRSVIATRRCQTNDVGRSAVLCPAFEHVARTAATDSLAQIEIGSSAGLNLNWDRYRYDVSGVRTFGDPDSPVTIATEVRGERRPPLSRTFPPVARRRGIDLNPLDVTDEDDVRWLRALIPPGRRRRRDRLAAAIEVARENPPALVEGDVLEELPKQLSEAPADPALVVFSTHVLYQLEAETIAHLRSLLAEYSTEQPVRWLAIDPDEELGKPTYRLVTFVDGDATESRLARFESYGNWIRWHAD
ncbi:DUF2332 domain-containing protein [Halosolutus amylolyticus]|uniref:DUF2332 domain-containing protein n=1 Tax=Halosolutus amylolyticus TaxID=2932267 RepID=A0ABD5PQJ6_9EURY|nr:DUF2332 domain-containing protein [Halosolutus amylolyticus]